MKILWVDDQIDAAQTFASILSSNGIDVEFSSDGEDALGKIMEYSYSLILMDLAMPPGRWGGLWLLEKLKQIDSPPPVIVVSGEGSQQETIQAIRLGASDYVTKENLPTELLGQLQAVLASDSAEVDAMRVMAGGECSSVEFKSTLRFNLHAKRPDSNIELAVLKSIVAFLNAAGGTVIIGVKDDGEVLGVTLDQFPNLDKFQLHFWNLVRDTIGPEFSEYIAAEPVKVKGVPIFVIRCSQSSRPVFLKWKSPGESKAQELFFVRAGPQTEQLGTRQALAYINSHFTES
ncbi:response regulator [Nitrosospira briensis]|uniref:Putative DNA-binding domain-containing protein n=1 Tax=Nitrosospira briensis TaxID=35799 RepID=A0A1I5CWK2_9PROT|nr:response regulator [Nitrosospira briensis]SFN91297.1 Putative DNA-binding domain-containing protein [Nitrosospira briensis]SFO43476.1 Putative DNA-binding domain-containing protein [Nitrosospira briensis]